jgi:Plasmid pRiA4b ORF-3-like protein
MRCGADHLIEASGRCPPEDVGGPWGYGEMLEALEDPGHERHAETLEWLGEDFDPNALNAEPLKADVAALAKRWTKGPSAKKTRSTGGAAFAGGLLTRGDMR